MTEMYPGDSGEAPLSVESAVAFVNKNSGERGAASFVYEQLQACLGEENVFDLFPTRGEPPVIDAARQYLAEKKPDMIIVAGGDGTVSLGMDIADGLRKEGKIGPHSCAVAVLPMGTGNDLSRSLGFGGGYAKPRFGAEKKFAKRVDEIKRARPKHVDRFRFDLYLVPAASKAGDDRDGAASLRNRPESSRHQQESVADEEDRENTFSDCGGGQQVGNPLTYTPPEGARKVMSKSFMNYFSVGFDADIAANFGEFRDNNPAACSSRTMNKMWYCCFGCQAMCCSSSFPRHRISLAIDGQKTKVSSKASAIVISNMLTYAGGAVLWQDGKSKFDPPAVDDGRVEVCVLNGVVHMMGVGTKTRSATKMGQGKAVRIRVPADYVMQYDGEPIAAQGDSSQDCLVYITHVGQSLGMELLDKNTGKRRTSTSGPMEESLHAEESVASS